MKTRLLRHLVLSLTFTAAGLAALPLNAAPLPKNLGNGLREILQERAAANIKPGSPPTAGLTTGRGKVDYAPMMQFDEGGNVLVDVILDSSRSYDEVRAAVLGVKGSRPVAEDRKYRGGILEIYLPLESVADVARSPGISAIHASLRPQTRAGSVQNQGVVQHRVDKIPQFTGAGITIGILSDSFDTNPFVATGAADDTASGDLPAAGVTILQDSGVGNDEGRAMCQVIYDMAPGAKLGFATANGGEVNFAKNIRSLAGLAGGTNALPGFKADIIVDDIIYFDEPFFSDGISSQAVDDVAAAGVSFFSAAGNDAPSSSYASEVRLVSASDPAAALAGTNINLTGVDPALYAGGFQNFNSAPGQQDVAQSLIAYGTDILLCLQWDDPYDVALPTPTGTAFTGSGTAANDKDGIPLPVDFVFNNTSANATYRVDVIGTSDQTTAHPVPLNAIITVLDPDGRPITGDEEVNSTAVVTLGRTGGYTIRVRGNDFGTGDGGDTGPFTVKVSTTSGVASRVTSDFNALIFDADGNFIGALGSDNRANHRPIEVGRVTLGPDVFDCQLVIARANTPAASPVPASRLHYTFFDGLTTPTEYFSPFTPTIVGHSSARGAISVGAYAPFRPFIPESYSSTGPATLLFDRNNQRLASPEVRLKPDLAAMDGANTTAFFADTSRDPDTFPNFFGTSCAAPNAAAIAALVLQRFGGVGSVTPVQMRTILQRSAFPHDLDPYYARGQAIAGNGQSKVVLTSGADALFYTLGVPNPTQDTIGFVGAGSLASITFDGSSGNPTGGSVNGSFPGLVFDPREDNGDFLTGGLPFTFGDARGLTPADVTAAYANQAPAPSQPGQFYKMTLSFTPGVFTGGKGLRYAVDRDEQHAAFSLPNGTSRGGDSADLLGGGVLIPEGTVLNSGVTFSGTLTDGSTFNGTMQNRIGAGYSILDGYGFINAESAVNQPLPRSTLLKD